MFVLCFTWNWTSDQATTDSHGPFARVGVDVVQIPKTKRGNRYVLVFMDYLTKWPPLTPIPVHGPFARVGVDVVQIPKTKRGNHYMVVFMDYLTETFATSDQTAPTLTRLLVEEVVSRHGVPRQLLSDRGPAFLSKLFLGVCSILGTKKVNTTVYHPQTDGLVEQFNGTLIIMLSKRVSGIGQEWDELLPYVLFAYRATLQSSTVSRRFIYYTDATPN